MRPKRPASRNPAPRKLLARSILRSGSMRLRAGGYAFSDSFFCVGCDTVEIHAQAHPQQHTGLQVHQPGYFESEESDDADLYSVPAVGKGRRTATKSVFGSAKKYPPRSSKHTPSRKRTLPGIDSTPSPTPAAEVHGKMFDKHQFATLLAVWMVRADLTVKGTGGEAFKAMLEYLARCVS